MNPVSWSLKDLKAIPRNGLKVFSTFSCGGGSTMGYKLAGCEVIAANDIDAEMQWHYQENFHPKNYFLCPIKDLLTMDLLKQLFGIDILDGSPPCSSFSTAGRREKDWQKEKFFREGQAAQVLDDLFFDFLKLAERLKPKCIIAENVEGLIKGNAKGYAAKIMRTFEVMGYAAQCFLVNAADCGVPQMRKRVFFCAVRKDMHHPPLKLIAKNEWISAQDACSDVDSGEGRARPNDLKYWHRTKPGESYSDTKKRLGEKEGCFSHIRIDGCKPSCVLTANLQTLTHWNHARELNIKEVIRLSSFPDDYIFRNERIGKYLMGMSVPPRMMQMVASAVCEQWLTGKKAVKQ